MWHKSIKHMAYRYKYIPVNVNDIKYRVYICTPKPHSSKWDGATHAPCYVFQICSSFFQNETGQDKELNVKY